MSFMTLTGLDFNGNPSEVRYNTDFVKVVMIKPLGVDKSYVYWISAIEIGNNGNKFRPNEDASKYGCDIVAESPAEVEARYYQATKPPARPNMQYFYTSEGEK